jgi:predicted HTH domain antitoxin
MSITKRQEEKMQQTAIAFSNNVLQSLNMTMEEIVSSMRKEYAKKMYQAGKLTLGQCAEFCSMDKYDFISLLADADIPVINYSVEDLKRELEANKLI